MMEAATVVNLAGEGVYWHAPPGRSTIAIPDTRDLWQIIWDHRHDLAGVAHSHPGAGNPKPSTTDISTFSAIEAGLGRHLSWWILSTTAIVELRWCGPHRTDYKSTLLSVEPVWACHLRQISYTSFAP